MEIDKKIRNEKLQYNITKEKAKLSAILSRKIDKHGYFTGKKKLPSDQNQMIEYAKFAYSPLGKALQNQIKSIENHSEIQTKAIEEQGKQIAEINMLGKRWLSYLR